MFYISCGVSQDFIIELLEKNEENGIHFKYEGKTGIKLKFSTDAADIDEAMAFAKGLIKSTQIGSVLYFQISK